MKNNENGRMVREKKKFDKFKIGFLALLVIWAGLVLLGLTMEDKEFSHVERRPLKQKMDMTVENLLDGSYMKNFEGYVLDQFPFRDEFRKIKSLVHYYGFSQKDNNDIYIYNHHAGKMDYPLNKSSVDYAVRKFDYIYERYLKGQANKIVMTIVPDKSCYMAEESGHLSYDYEKLAQTVEDKVPWAEQVEVSDLLTLDDYYRTDTHWRQEKIMPVAERIADKLGVTIEKDYTLEKLERPFYGVYYGQAALPMKPDEMVMMKNPILDKCRVYDYESNRYLPVYNMEKAQGKDMYETFLSGAKALLEIENPACEKGKELVVFRDSFGSSLVPLLVKEYSKITVVDIRYIPAEKLENLVKFKNKDVLIMYNSVLINNSVVLK